MRISAFCATLVGLHIVETGHPSATKRSYRLTPEGFPVALLALIRSDSEGEC
jgi:hypothetical protein